MEKNKILITSGVGTGLAEVAAFDAALVACGIHNFNLITLSSVIPSTHEIVRKQGALAIGNQNNWGHRLYVVMAKAFTSQKNEEVWAGIGWVQDAATGEGLFVEHHANSKSEIDLLIQKSIAGLSENRARDFGLLQSEVVGAVCDGRPTTVLAVAVYQIRGWDEGVKE